MNPVFKSIAAGCLAAMIFLASALAQPVSPDQRAKISFTTSMGAFVVELRGDLAPKTVENFLKYVDGDFFNGKIFHRVILGFMIQGGGFDVNMAKAKTRAPIPNEAARGLKNVRGTIAMARTADINSATAQFFINTKDNPFLDHVPGDPSHFGYAAFGRVIQGMDVVDAISGVKTGAYGYFRDVPKTPVVILKAERLGAPDDAAPFESDNREGPKPDNPKMTLDNHASADQMEESSAQ